MIFQHKNILVQGSPIRSVDSKTTSHENRNTSRVKITEITEDAPGVDYAVRKDSDPDVIWDQSCSCDSDRSKARKIIIQESPYVKMINTYRRFRRAKGNFGLSQDAGKS